MAVPIADFEYHWMQFTDLTIAATFVAALTRFLASSRGSKYLRPSASAEVWSYVLGTAEDIERIDIYMNDVAMNAVKESMGKAPLSQKRRGSQLQPDCILLIGGGGVEEWGTEEAQWHLLSEG